MITQALWAALGMILLTSTAAAAAGADDLKALFIIQQGGKTGYMDRTGKMVIPFRRGLDLGDFSHGRVPIAIKGKYGYIDRGGKVVIKPQFDRASSFHRGLALVKAEGLYGFINPAGKLVIPPSLTAIQFFTETS